MIINGLNLPSGFVEAVASGRLNRRIGCWTPKNELDAFSRFWEGDLGDVYSDEGKIFKESSCLSEHFKADGVYGQPPHLSDWKGKPGFIPDIVDFTEVLCFGNSADGAPLCFDFRGAADSPRVIWWADVYWRLIAPDFDSFLQLFDFGQPPNNSLQVSAG